MLLVFVDGHLFMSFRLGRILFRQACAAFPSCIRFISANCGGYLGHLIVDLPIPEQKHGVGFV